MKSTVQSLKAKAASPAAITAVVVALAAWGSGAMTMNHNETLLRDKQQDGDPKEEQL